MGLIQFPIPAGVIGQARPHGPERGQVLRFTYAEWVLPSLALHAPHPPNAMDYCPPSQSGCGNPFFSPTTSVNGAQFPPLSWVQTQDHTKRKVTMAVCHSSFLCLRACSNTSKYWY